MSGRRGTEGAAAGGKVVEDVAAGLQRMWHLVMQGFQPPPVLHGLHHQQFWVLGKLAGGPRRMSELAESTGTTQANVTGMVDRLEERGLIERVRCEEDRRVVLVALTPDGRRGMRAGKLSIRRRIEGVLARLTPAEQTELARLLNKAFVDEED